MNQKTPLSIVTSLCLFLLYVTRSYIPRGRLAIDWLLTDRDNPTDTAQDLSSTDIIIARANQLTDDTQRDLHVLRFKLRIAF